MIHDSHTIFSLNYLVATQRIEISLVVLLEENVAILHYGASKYEASINMPFMSTTICQINHMISSQTLGFRS